MTSMSTTRTRRRLLALHHPGPGPALRRRPLPRRHGQGGAQRPGARLDPHPVGQRLLHGRRRRRDLHLRRRPLRRVDGRQAAQRPGAVAGARPRPGRLLAGGVRRRRLRLRRAVPGVHGQRPAQQAGDRHGPLRQRLPDGRRGRRHLQLLRPALPRLARRQPARPPDRLRGRLRLRSTGGPVSALDTGYRIRNKIQVLFPGGGPMGTRCIRRSSSSAPAASTWSGCRPTRMRWPSSCRRGSPRPTAARSSSTSTGSTTRPRRRATARATPSGATRSPTSAPTWPASTPTPTRPAGGGRTTTTARSRWPVTPRPMESRPSRAGTRRRSRSTASRESSCSHDDRRRDASIRTTATVELGNPVRANGQLRYITRVDGEFTSGRYAFVADIAETFTVESVEFLDPNHPIYQLRPADPLTVTFGIYYADMYFCYPGGEGPLGSTHGS